MLKTFREFLPALGTLFISFVLLSIIASLFFKTALNSPIFAQETSEATSNQSTNTTLFSGLQEKIGALVKTLGLSDTILLQQLPTNNYTQKQHFKSPLSAADYQPGEILIKLKSSPLQSGPAIEVKPERKASGINLERKPVSYSDLQPNKLPQAIRELNQRYPIKTIEKVFKGFGDPKKEIASFKARFPQRAVQVKKEAEKIDLSKIYKLTFDKRIPVEQIIEELSSRPEIEYVEPNYLYSADANHQLPNDPFYLDSYPNPNRDPNWDPPHDYQWNIKKTNSSSNFLTDTSSIIVAVIDTGVDVNHPELGNVWVNLGEIPNDNIDNDNNGCIDDLNGCNMTTVPLSGDIADDNDHGTHVAGIISAKTNNGIGIAGVTSNTQIMAVKVFRRDGFALPSFIAQGILYAVRNGAKVLNLSLGGSESKVMKDALDFAINTGVIPVVAAGNGNIYSPSHFPASYRPVITVGGIDENLNKLKYAAYGPNIDVVAPAGGKPCGFFDKPSYCSNILSLKSSQNNKHSELVVGEKYMRWSGTSFAAPHVAGVVALLLARNPQLSLTDIENYLIFNSLNENGTVHTEKLGWGVINAQGNDFIPSLKIDFVIDYPAENSLIGLQFNVAGTINADNFDHFEVSYRQKGRGPWSTEGVELVNSGNFPIIPRDPWIAAKAASVSLPENSPVGIYEIKVTLHLTDGRNLSVIKNVNLLKKPGTNWLYKEGKPKFGNILIADLNNDGHKEIILYNYGEEFSTKGIAVFDDKYNLLWQADEPGQAVAGELDYRNSGKEVAIHSNIHRNKVYIYNSDGNLIADLTMSKSAGETNILIIDADNNGRNELYVGGTVYEQNVANQFVEKWHYPNACTLICPIGGDINGDGFKEIIFLTSDNKLAAVNFQGQLIAQYPFPGGTYYPDAMILVDIDNDGREEIVVHQRWGDTILLKLTNHSFFPVWSINNSNNIEGLSAGDFNQDGYPEVYVFVDNTLSAKIIDRNGNLIYDSWTPFYNPASGNTEVLLADRDNNGLLEFYHTGHYTTDQRVYLGTREYNFQTGEADFIDGEWKSVIPEWQSLSGNKDNIKYLNNSSIPSAITDLDGNGRLDLVIAGIGIIEYNTEGSVYWAHLYHDFQRTASYNFSSPLPTPTPSATPNPQPGDLNGDGTVDFKDFLSWRFLEKINDPRTDTNNDGQTNILDYLFILKIWGF